MMLPWIARSAHQALVGMLREELFELKAERRMLLDRLAVLGLGGPLYAAEAEREAPAEQEETAADPEQEFAEELLRLRRRPAKLADALTRSMQRTRGRRAAGPRVAWVPEGDAVKAALDQAEALGRRSVAG